MAMRRHLGTEDMGIVTFLDGIWTLGDKFIQLCDFGIVESKISLAVQIVTVGVKIFYEILFGKFSKILLLNLTSPSVPFPFPNVLSPTNVSMPKCHSSSVHQISNMICRE
jgi:hypothetical protein